MISTLFAFTAASLPSPTPLESSIYRHFTESTGCHLPISSSAPGVYQFDCSTFSSLNCGEFGAITASTPNADLKVRYCGFTSVSSTTHGAVDCRDAHQLFLHGSRFVDCRGPLGFFVYVESDRRCDLSTSLFTASSPAGRDAIRAKAPHHSLTGLNVSSVAIAGFGASLGVEGGALFSLFDSRFVNQSGLCCLWFDGLSRDSSSISDISICGFTAPHARGAIMSYTSLAIAGSLFVGLGTLFESPVPGVVLELDMRCRAGVGVTYPLGVPRVTDSWTIAWWWPLAEFTSGHCVTLAATPSLRPSPTRSRSPHPTAPQTESASLTASASRSPTASPEQTSVGARTPWPATVPASGTPTASARATPTASPSLTPTATPPFVPILGGSAGGGFLIAAITLVIVVICRDCSSQSSDDTVGLFDPLNERVEKSSDESDSDPLRIHGGGSSESDD
jgi:hypothetical protein